jgi:hypothetical protein
MKRMYMGVRPQEISSMPFMKIFKAGEIIQ